MSDMLQYIATQLATIHEITAVVRAPGSQLKLAIYLDYRAIHGETLETHFARVVDAINEAILFVQRASGFVLIEVRSSTAPLPYPLRPSTVLYLRPPGPDDRISERVDKEN